MTNDEARDPAASRGSHKAAFVSAGRTSHKTVSFIEWAIAAMMAGESVTFVSATKAQAEETALALADRLKTLGRESYVGDVFVQSAGGATASFTWPKCSEQ